MAQSALKGCEICVRGPGNNFCLECEQFLCDDCKTLHGRQQFSKNHKFKSDLSDIPEVKSRCKEHNEDFIFLCVECDVPLCRRCITGHKGHEISNIDDVIAKLKDRITKSTETKSKQTNDVIYQLDNGLQSLESTAKDVIKKIKDEGTRLKDMIDREVEKRVSMLKEKVKIEKEKLNQLLAEARVLKESENKLFTQLGIMQQKQEDAILLEKHEKLKTYLEGIGKLKSLTVSRFPSITYASKSVTQDTMSNLLGEYTIQELMEKKDLHPVNQPKRSSVLGRQGNLPLPSNRGRSNVLSAMKSPGSDNPEKEIPHSFLYRCRMRYYATKKTMTSDKDTETSTSATTVRA